MATEAERMVLIEKAMGGMEDPKNTEACHRILTWALSRWGQETVRRMVSAARVEAPSAFVPTINGFPLTREFPFEHATRAQQLDDGLPGRTGPFTPNTGDIDFGKLADDQISHRKLKDIERTLSTLLEQATAKSAPSDFARQIFDGIGQASVVWLLQSFTSEVLTVPGHGAALGSMFASGEDAFIYTEEGKAFAAAVWDELGQLVNLTVEPPKD